MDALEVKITSIGAIVLSLSDIAMLADDLTGACDLAACFAQAGKSISVIVNGIQAANSDGPAVLNTQSRLLGDEQSRTLLKSVGRAFSDRRIIFKKIDTALRGSVGAEIDGLLQSVTARQVVVAPAAPRIGRTTRGGIQYDNDVPIDKCPYANDLLTPVDCADIAEVLRRVGRAQIKICDAQTDDDLQRIVDENLCDEKVLFVGSLGLANALTKRLEGSSATKQAPVPPPASRPMIVCGSRYSASQRQIVAARCAGAKVLGLRIDQPSPVPCQKEISWPLVVCIDEKTVGSSKRSAEISKTFISAVVGLIEKAKPDSLGIVGGETAYDLMRAMGVTRLVIRGRLQQIVACGTMSDGPMAGRSIATKGGSVGGDDAMLHMLSYLSGQEGVGC